MAKNMSESFNPSYMSIIFGDMYDMNDITRNDIEKKTSDFYSFPNVLFYLIFPI